jgi:hypothetical protein
MRSLRCSTTAFSGPRVAPSVFARGTAVVERDVRDIRAAGHVADRERMRDLDGARNDITLVVTSGYGFFRELACRAEPAAIG